MNTRNLLTVVMMVVLGTWINATWSQEEPSSDPQSQEGPQYGPQYAPQYKRPYDPPEPKSRVVEQGGMVELEGGEAVMGGGGPVRRGRMGGLPRVEVRGLAPEVIQPFSNGPRRSFRGATGSRGSGDYGSGPVAWTRNGRRTIEASESRRYVKIIHDLNTGEIDMTIVRQYAADEMESLKRKMPDLADYIDVFPSKLGSAKIDLSISITEQYRADSPEDLREQNAAAYNLFQRYSRQADRGGMNNAGVDADPGQGRSGVVRKPRNLPVPALGSGGNKTNHQ